MSGYPEMTRVGGKGKMGERGFEGARGNFGAGHLDCGDVSKMNTYVRFYQIIYFK